MPRIVANIPSVCQVEFDAGRFDDWCVYLTRPGVNRFAPKDHEYFSRLKSIGDIFGHDKVYKDFISIYSATTQVVDADVISMISTISKSYDTYSNEMTSWFIVIYAAMIAEENKQFAILKKRIKRLGVHQVLIDDMLPTAAASFSYRKPWRVLDAICSSKGF